MPAVCQIVKLPGCVSRRLCFKLRKMPRISQKTKLLELLTGSILSDILYLHILYDALPPGLQVTRVTYLLLVENSDNSDFQQFNKIFNSPEAVELLKFLTVDFVWNSWLTADQNSTIQQFNNLGNTQNILYICLHYTMYIF